jgi:alkyl hydroperoxide reductase subunit AhpC
MALRINDEAPNFTADTTAGEINFHDWIGDGWVVLFSHPKDFTPVCTTELGYMAGLADEFTKRNTKIIGISVDPVDSHHKWKQDIKDISGHDVEYLINNLELVEKIGTGDVYRTYHYRLREDNSEYMKDCINEF